MLELRCAPQTVSDMNASKRDKKHSIVTLSWMTCQITLLADGQL